MYGLHPEYELHPEYGLYPEYGAEDRRKIDAMDEQFN